MRKGTVVAGIVILLIVAVCIYSSYMYNGLNADESEVTAQQNSILDRVDNNKKDNDRGEGVLRGFAAPDFKLNTVNGDIVNLSDYKGKIVFLNFWTTWSSLCEDELPIIAQQYNKYASENDVVIFSINVGSNEEKVKEFIQDKNFVLNVLLDSEQMTASSYNIGSFPTTFVIDKDARIYDIITDKINESTIDEYVYRIKSVK